MVASKILNLWDMLKEYAVVTSWLISELSHHELDLGGSLVEEQSRLFGSALTAKKLKIDQGDVTRINTYLPHVENFAANLNLETAALTANRIRCALERGDYLKCHLVEDVKNLRARLHDELITRKFIYIDSKFAKYYRQPDLFGQEVNDCFPASIDDIQDAGTALATGLGTSCVMHLMRIIEAALKVLASGLGIPYAISWEAYLTKIEKNISAKHTTKSPEWKTVEKFYRDVSGDLFTIKQAWRNPTMHIERSYSTEEAEQIFLAVKTLMQRMALNLKPKEQPVLTLITGENRSSDN